MVRFANWMGSFPNTPQYFDPRTVTNVRNMWLTFHPDADWTFVKVLWRARPYFAVNARDKVYALLGHQSVRFDRKGVTPVTVDHKRTVEEVFLDIAVATIQESKSIDIITHVHQQPQTDSATPTLPSWVPRWDVDGPVSLSRNVHYNTANETVAFVYLSADKTSLTVEGFALDRIVRHSQVMTGDEFLTDPPAGPIEENPLYRLENQLDSIPKKTEVERKSILKSNFFTATSKMKPYWIGCSARLLLLPIVPRISHSLDGTTALTRRSYVVDQR